MTTIRCIWCNTPATGSVFEADHTGMVCNVMPTCDEHGQNWDGTSIHGRHACWFDARIFRNFTAWIDAGAFRWANDTIIG